jgi:NADPH-dependent 2,4-dienoyl-CoA reductase/sulfur reductase-like enzyme
VVADVAILGAGPYGLAAAASLRNAGMTVSVVGRPMSFWERMPLGMLLRSPYAATSIGDPRGPLSLDAFASSTGTTIGRPMPLEQFIDYGRWFQARAVPDVDPRQVVRVERDDGVYRMVLEDATETVARRLVVAAGIGFFPRIPPVFCGVPAERVSHASAHRDPSMFSDRHVLVVGAGQSALETAALLAESGANVQIAARSTTVIWLGRRPWLRKLGPVSTLVYAPAEVGPPLLCRLVEAPSLVRRISAGGRDRLDHRSIRPAGAAWLKSRVVGSVPILPGHEVVAVADRPDGLAVGFSNGRETVVDHVVLGTGYRVDLGRYPFLAPDLLRDVRTVDGYPVLGQGFESSVPGLHFLGAPAAWTFGPLMRFVAGTSFAATELPRVLHRPASPGRKRRVAAAV